MDEVKIEVCCDPLRDAIDKGCVQVVEITPGNFAEAIPDERKQVALRIDYCPFCGKPRKPDIVAPLPSA